MVWGITVVECAALVILLAIQQPGGLVHDMLSAPALVRLGRLSYGIYLWHYPVVRYLRAEYSWPVVVVLGLAISAALAALSLYTIERWALRWRDRAPSGARTAVRKAPGLPCARRLDAASLSRLSAHPLNDAPHEESPACGAFFFSSQICLQRLSRKREQLLIQ